MNDDVLRAAMGAVDTAINDPPFAESARSVLLKNRPILPALSKAVSIDSVLDERKLIHGDFTDDASASQRLKSVMRNTENWERLNEVQREALEQIATKLGRILTGDPGHKDTWIDIQGYARLVEQRL